MAVTTSNYMRTTTMNPETEKVMDTISGKRTQKQIIQQFFWLDDKIVMDVDGTTVLEVFNDFVDPVKLKEKWVTWIPKLESLGVTKEYFDSLLGKYLNYATIESGNTQSTGSADSESWVEASEKPTRGRKKKSAE